MLSSNVRCSLGVILKFSKVHSCPLSCNISRFVSISSAPAPSPQSQPDAHFLLENLSDTHEGIVLFSLNRPESKNAISLVLRDQFRAAIDATANNKHARIVILRSTSPGVFCAGADLKERAKMKEADVAPLVASFRALVSDLHALPMPTIAALDGLAVGGGLEMALACDLRVAASSTKMGLVETKLGIIPGAGGTQFLTRLIGASRAKEMIFTGDVIDGAQAKKLGLVNVVMDQNEKGNAAYLGAVGLAERILSNGPIALRMAKRAIDRGGQLDLKAGLKVEEESYAKLIATKDRLEGLAAFKEKRKARFTGQ